MHKLIVFFVATVLCMAYFRLLCAIGMTDFDIGADLFISLFCGMVLASIW